MISYQRQADSVVRYVVVDAGYSQTYHRTLAGAIRQIGVQNSPIDLFVLTHTDSDHIGGILPFLNEFGTSMVTQFWMNYSPTDLPGSSSGAISITQAITVRDRITADIKLNSEPILAGQQYQIGDELTLQILSPDRAQYDLFVDKWKAWENDHDSHSNQISKTSSDHSESVETLVQRPFIPDSSWSNRSSIAFLLKAAGVDILLTGDAYPSVIAASIREAGYSEQKPLRLDLLKVAHHGSKGNTDEDLLGLLDCQHYLISTNGSNPHLFPHKEALSRIIHAALRRHQNKAIHFFFTYDDPVIRAIFNQEEIDLYGLYCHYPVSNENNIRITYPQN